MLRKNFHTELFTINYSLFINTMLDAILVSIFVLGAGTYLAWILVKKIRALRDPQSSAGCNCGCDCFRKNALPPHLRKK